MEEGLEICWMRVLVLGESFPWRSIGDCSNPIRELLKRPKPERVLRLMFQTHLGTSPPILFALSSSPRNSCWPRRKSGNLDKSQDAKPKKPKFGNVALRTGVLMSSDSLFHDRLRTWRFLRPMNFSNSTEPLNPLALRSRYMISPKSNIESGIGPCNWLYLKSRYRRRVRFPSLGGIVPSNRLKVRLKYMRRVKFARDDGILPPKFVQPTSKNTSWDSLPIQDGKLTPLKLL